MSIDLTQVVVSILVLVISTILGWASKVIIPRLSKILDEKLSSAQKTQILAVITSLVEAAQQMYEADQTQEKLDYVTKELESRGITVDRAQIESAVYKMKEQTMTSIQEIFEDNTIEDTIDEEEPYDDAAPDTTEE